MTIITANIIFFTLINRLANSIDKLMYPIDNLSVSDQEQLYHKTHDQKIRNIFLFDVGFMGGSTLLFNKLVLPKITNYPLSRAVVLAITGTAVVTRIILRMYSMLQEDELDLSEINKWKEECFQLELGNGSPMSREEFEKIFEQFGKGAMPIYKQKRQKYETNTKKLLEQKAAIEHERKIAGEIVESEKAH